MEIHKYEKQKKTILGEQILNLRIMLYVFLFFKYENNKILTI